MIRKTSLLLITVLILACASVVTAVSKIPTEKELQREEVAIKEKLAPILQKSLKKRYLALAVKVLYVKQIKPIVNNGTKTKEFKLPGFERKVTLSNKIDGISGYIDNFQRYRNLTLLVTEPLSRSLEQSLSDLLREKADFSLSNQDSFNIVVVAATLASARETAKKPKSKQSKKEEEKERFARLFPELDETPINIDARQEAESSKHLISSRTAFFNNDLNSALNEVIEAISINPYSSKSYEMLGSIYYRLQWRQLALENWNKALALDPSNKTLNKFIVRVKREL